MSNFDFLKNFNPHLCDIGTKLENDVIKSPRAVTADATLFLETLVDDIYKLSNTKINKNLKSFYKKVENLYRLGEISYIFKNKLQDAYSLRSKIHNNFEDSAEEKELAFDLHQRLFYISKKYFKDYCNQERYIIIPDYKKPEYLDVYFENCIICGKDNRESLSNMCNECNRKIENGNFLISIQNSLKKKNFTRQDLTKLGISESESISLLMNLVREKVVQKTGDSYSFSEDILENYLDEVNQYIKIALLITKFYKDEIPASEIKNRISYVNGSLAEEPFCEFFKIVNDKIKKDFEENIIKFKSISKSIRKSSMDDNILKEWLNYQKEEFLNGSINDAFILYNEILSDKFFKFKRKGYKDERILRKLSISNEIYDFWQNEFMGDDFLNQTKDIKKEIIIKEIRKNNSLLNAIKTAGLTKKEFDRMYLISKESNDKFFKDFQREYIQKRQKLLLKHLKEYNLDKAIRLCKITKEDFLRWYYNCEVELSSFYINTTKLLMEKFLQYRKEGLSKNEILKKIGISKELYKSWNKHRDLEFVIDFIDENNKITSNLLKRGLVINNLKEGHSKEDAISLAGLTSKEFLVIYNTSKKEKTDFYIRFDREYIKNRKDLFKNLIHENDFFNTIEKCEISQTDFNKWYLHDQDKFISNNEATDFYIKTTQELMDKYLKARCDGKNKPDAARSIGLSNIIINKWIKHPEFDLFNDFKQRYNQLNIDLIIYGFSQGKSKSEVSEIFDISLKTIDKFINLGKTGFKKYEKIYDLYENSIIPKQLDVFLDYFKTKSLNKSLKQAKLSKNELNYYFDLGNNGDVKFMKFSKKFLDLKVNIYVDNIIAKKSHKIALKNSSLNKGELLEFKDTIDDLVLTNRMKIVCETILNHRTNGVKLANKIGVDIEDIYDWYIKGIEGDKRYKYFSIIFNVGIVMPRVSYLHNALEIGIPKNWLCKKIKKELGDKDFKLWQKYNLFKRDDIENITLYDLDLDEKQLKDLIIKSNILEFSESTPIVIKSLNDNFVESAVIKKTVIDENGNILDKEIFNE